MALRAGKTHKEFLNSVQLGLLWTRPVSGHDFSAQRPARERALTRIPDSPRRRAALCAESEESRAGTGLGP
jgi:hypothetical protein